MERRDLGRLKGKMAHYFGKWGVSRDSLGEGKGTGDGTMEEEDIVSEWGRYLAMW